MSAQNKSLTAEELLHLAEDHQRHELINGALTTMPPNTLAHGLTAAALMISLGQHVEANHLGAALVGCGFLLRRDPDTVRAADLSFVSKERLDRLGRFKGYPPYAPDLAVDIIDPWELYVDVMDKVADWLDAGTRLVLVIDPNSRTVMVHRADAPMTRLTEDDQIDGADVVPGWTLPVRALFE